MNVSLCTRPRCCSQIPSVVAGLTGPTDAAPVCTHNSASELRRIALPRTPRVNNGGSASRVGLCESPAGHPAGSAAPSTYGFSPSPTTPSPPRRGMAFANSTPGRSRTPASVASLAPQRSPRLRPPPSGPGRACAGLVTAEMMAASAWFFSTPWTIDLSILRTSTENFFKKDSEE